MPSGAHNAIARLRGLSLRTELAAGFGAVIVLTLVAGAVSLLAQYRSTVAVNTLVSVVTRIADLSQSSTVAMLKARRAEKDFLIFRNEFGFEEARSRYSTLFRTSLAEVRQSMADLRELSSEPDVVQTTRSIDQSVGRYEAGFLRVVDLYGLHGHVGTGVEGQFRDKAHAIEALVGSVHDDRLMVGLLTLRRHEKDYIARGIDKYAEGFAKGIDEFKAAIAVARVPTGVRLSLLGLTADYQRLFEQYVQIDARIDSEQSAYLAAAHTIEPLLERLHASAQQVAYVTGTNAERQAEFAIWTIGGAVLMAALLGLAVALTISRSITRSVAECLGFATRVAQGDLSTRLAPKGDTEFGTLAVALNRMTEAVEEREDGLRRAQNMARLASVTTTSDGTFESWSDTLPGLLGVRPAEMPQSTREWIDHLHPLDRESFRSASLQAADTGARADVEYRLRQGETGWIHIRQMIDPMGSRDAEGKGRWFSTLQDITEQKSSELRIRRLNRVYAVSSGINALIVRARDREELFREACRIAVEEGRFAKAWIGMVDPASNEFRIVAACGGDPGFFPQLELLLREKIAAGRGSVAKAFATLMPAVSNDIANDPEVLLKDHALGSDVRALAVLPLVVAGAAVGVLALNADAVGFFDAEEMKLLSELAGDIAFAIDHIEKQERLAFLASYDELTGLANRSLYLGRLADFLAARGNEARKLAVVVIDIERFRSINESAGRQAGDHLLRLFTARLQSNMIDPKWLARTGPDQFASIIPDAANAEAVARVEQRMSQVLNEPFALEGLDVRVSLKIGIALFPRDGTDAVTLLQNAEAALKKAKAAGERYLFYAPEMTARVAANLAMENRLRMAVENEEFVLHYQPKVDLQSGKLTSVEALIRWNDPRTGLVPPGHFIPILEETGLILDVGRWALHQAIKEYLRWRAAGLPAVRIAVNVSPIQLRNRGFVAEIEKAVGVHPNAAAGLELEITESVIMHDVRQNIATLKSIRALGVTVAIDDFGTGFSSLAYLSKLPVDTLKIDRSFVVDMTTGPQGMALVSTVIKLAHSLELKVVAEGVETAEQSSLLRLLGCDEMQGFLFSRPLPAEDFEARFLAACVTAQAP